MTAPSQPHDEALRAKVDTWVAQAYTNGGLDTYAAPGNVQGYEACTELIMQVVEAAVLAERLDEVQLSLKDNVEKLAWSFVDKQKARISALQAQQANLNREQA